MKVFGEVGATRSGSTLATFADAAGAASVDHSTFVPQFGQNLSVT
jgi:hypothetical protein